MSVYFDKFLSDQKCGFQKAYSTQPCLLNLLEKWKNFVYKGKSFGALLTDLSKAFDCLDHELLTAKLNAYGFTLSALRLIHDYLSNKNKEQRLMIIIVFGQKYYLAFLTVQVLLHFFLIFSWLISFLW